MKRHKKMRTESTNIIKTYQRTSQQLLNLILLQIDQTNQMRQEEEQSLSKLQETSNNPEPIVFSNHIPPPGYDPMQRARHVYLEQENIYGRFVPYLLLKDQLESEMDSSGNTALHHMCSHNSPYIPLYLSTLQKGDPILNKKSKMGHTPLDVAGLYCPLDIIELMKEKGAIDDGNVDHWAIQGANIANWSGKVDENKKFLIHWAAYNDLPDVLLQYNRIGVNLAIPDTNGHSAMDLAILNKSYSSFKVLADLGYRPKPQLLVNCDSKSIKSYLKKLQEPSYMGKMKQYIKLLTFLCIMAACLHLSFSDFNIIFCSIASFFWAFLILVQPQPQPYYNDNRTTVFKSQLLKGATINKNNYLLYILLHLFIILAIVVSLWEAEITLHYQAFTFLVLMVIGIAFGIHLLVLVYGVCRNLTYSQMFYSYKWAHLWGKIKYIQERKILIRQFSNPYDNGTSRNITNFFSN